jgi:gluconolactonase
VAPVASLVPTVSVVPVASVAEPLVALSRFETLVDGLDHPECVAWGPDGAVYAGGEAGQIYRVSLDGSYEQFGGTGGFVLGLCLDGDSNVYACDSALGSVVRVSPSGEVSTYFAGLAGRPLVNPNYPVLDAAGNLYVSESGCFHMEDGRLWVVRPGGAGEVLRGDVAAFPNGLALSADGAYLYAAVSTLPGVVRVPLGGGPSETVAIFEQKVPDGLAFDAEGRLYVSFYSPDEIWRVTPGGEAELFASDWERTVLASPTNLAFCGPGLRTLVVASLGRWHLAKAEVDVGGQPLHYPKLS